MKECSFISLYQEPVNVLNNSSLPNKILLGTQTNTDSREQSDQDPRNFGTLTSTATRENRDSDASCYNQYSIIPQ